VTFRITRNSIIQCVTDIAEVKGKCNERLPAVAEEEMLKA